MPHDVHNHFSLREIIKRAERHVSEGERHISTQKELIDELMSHGLDVSRYVAMLETFQVTQRLHVQHLKTLRRELHEALWTKPG